MIINLKFLPVLFFVSIVATTSASGYQGFEADYNTCTTGQGKVKNDQVVSACSRLIKNAVKENEAVGMFYALRASANNDKKSNCRDAHKARKLIKDPNLKGAINTLEKTNC